MRNALSIALIALAAVPALAQSQKAFVTTLEVRTVTQQAAGEFRGCSVNFRTMAEDYQYKKGSLVMVDGSLNLNLMRQGDEVIPGFLLKLGTLEMGKKELEAPHFAYVQTSNGSSARSTVNQGPAENKGYTLYVVRFDEAMRNVLLEMMEKGKFRVGFNRKENGADVMSEVDMRIMDAKVSDTSVTPLRSDKALHEFVECIGKALDEMQRK